MIIERNSDIYSTIEYQKNQIATIISRFLKPKYLYFELGIMTEKIIFGNMLLQIKIL